MKKVMFFLIVILMISVGACSSSNDEDETEESITEVHGDIREKTASVEELPTFLAPKADEMKTLYKAVSQNQELLESIPCYCGCGETHIGHQDNFDCFIHQNNDDGSIVWDDHATRCQACLDIAAESIIEFHNGTPIKDIRKLIDEKYEDNYPAPTPTPEV